MKIHFFKKPLSSFASMWGVALLALSSVSCDTYTGTGALLGAAAGAAIGNNNSDRGYYHRGGYRRGGHYHRGNDNTLKGALIGAAAGGLIGAAAEAARPDRYRYRGSRYDRYEDNRYNNNGYYGDDYRYFNEDRDARADTYRGPAQSDSAPYARSSNRDGIVISPHPPFSEVDVSGLNSGQKALDPTSGKAFRVP